MGEKTIDQWMKTYSIDASDYRLDSATIAKLTTAKSALVDICGPYTTQQVNQIIGVKEKTEQEKSAKFLCSEARFVERRFPNHPRCAEQADL